MIRTSEGLKTMSKLKTEPAMKLMRRFMRDEGGATAIEYAMIASGVAVAIATTIVTLGSSVQGMYSSVASVMK